MSSAPGLGVTRSKTHFGCLLHLVSYVDLAELLKEADQREVEFLTSGLGETGVCQVHQL